MPGNIRPFRKGFEIPDPGEVRPYAPLSLKPRQVPVPAEVVHQDLELWDEQTETVSYTANIIQLCLGLPWRSV